MNYYIELYSKPLSILLDASAGAADYANKFGEPIISGITRSFGQVLPSGCRSEYIKPIVLSNGFGCCYDTIHNDDLIEEDIVIAKVLLIILYSCIDWWSCFPYGFKGWCFIFKTTRYTTFKEASFNNILTSFSKAFTNEFI